MARKGARRNASGTFLRIRRIPKDREQIKTKFLIVESTAEPRFQQLSFGFY
jgi:hypothetical protein